MRNQEQEIQPGAVRAASPLGHIGGPFAAIVDKTLAAVARHKRAEEREASLPPAADVYTMRPQNGVYVKKNLFTCHLCDDSGAVMVPMNVQTQWGLQKHLVAFGCDCGSGGKITTYADHFGLPYRNGPEYAEILRRAKEAKEGVA